MLEQVKALARALATANGHPDPDGYAESVAEHFASQNPAPAPANPAAPAA